MLQRLCFLIPKNHGEIRRAWAQHLAHALERRGVSTSIVDIPEKGLQQVHLHQILLLRPEMTCSFSPVPTSGKILLCDYLKIPHVSMLVEPAIYHLYLAKSAYSIASCIDYFDCELFFNAHCERVFFFGFAVTPQDLLAPNEEKIYDVVFLGKVPDPQDIKKRWKATYNSDINQVLERAVELTLGDDNTAFAQALVYAWRQSGVDPRGSDFVQLCREVEIYSRAIGSIEMIRNLQDVNIQLFDVDVCNKNALEKPFSFDDFAHVQVHPNITPQRAWEVLRQSKICLSTAHCFKHGAQAEIIYGLAAGAAVLAGSNKYLEVHFGEERGVISYLYGDWERVNERIQHYLTHESERNSIVEAGRKMLMLEHTWDVRADEFLKRATEFRDMIASEHYIRSFS